MTASSERFFRTAAQASLGAMLAMALAACQAEEPADYEADAEDMSGGELIAEPVDPEAVPVDLPETEMTPVPEDEAAAEGAAAE